MVNRNQLIPLVLRNSSTSIYFSFKHEEFYEVKFEGALTRVFSGNQKANTFFISLIMIYIISPIGIFVLNQFIFHSKLISAVFSFVIGLSLGYFLVKMVLSEIKEKKQVRLSKTEVKSIAKQAILGGRVLNITIICLLLFSMIGLLISLNLPQREFSRFLLYNGISGFAIMGIKSSSHPKLMIRAGKILKRKLKSERVRD